MADPLAAEMRVDLFFYGILKKPQLLHPSGVADPDMESSTLKSAGQSLLGDGGTDDLWPLLLEPPTKKPV